jgi:hypothetical protein
MPRMAVLANPRAACLGVLNKSSVTFALHRLRHRPERPDTASFQRVSTSQHGPGYTDDGSRKCGLDLF